MKSLEEIINSINASMETKEVFITPSREVFTIEKMIDYDTIDPRKDCDNLGHLMILNDRYNLSDVRISTLPKEAIFRPIYTIEHGGISIATSPFSDGWDSRYNGIIYTTPKEAQEWGITDTLEILETLEMEVKIYNEYLNTTFYNIVITNEITGDTHTIQEVQTDQDIEEFIRDTLSRI